MPTPPISTTLPNCRTVMAAARTGFVPAQGGSRSSTQSMVPGAACFIRSRSCPSSPVSFTVRRRGPKRRAKSSSIVSFRPGATTKPAPIARATATAALPKFPVAPLTRTVSPACRFAASRPP